jgi:lysine-N-methylase
MRYVYPDYYKKFQCVGGECIDTCCAGWQVDVDDNSACMYKAMPMPIGKKLVFFTDSLE